MLRALPGVDARSGKRLKILNLGDDQVQGGAMAAALDRADSDDDAVDPHLNRIKTAREAGEVAEESDEELEARAASQYRCVETRTHSSDDEDFVAEKDDSGSPSDESDDGDGDGGGSAHSGGSHGSADAASAEKSAKKEKKKEAVRDEKEKKGKASSSAGATPGAGAGAATPGAKRKKKEKEGGDDEGGGKKKQARKKKDPNAPKRALSGFMYFSQAEREVLKQENPSMAFGDIGKAIGERWKAMSGEQKAPYENKAKADKARYAEQMAGYKSGGAAAPASGGGAADDDEDEDTD
eukprot:jgi/Mesen1/5683/ME000288S04896